MNEEEINIKVKAGELIQFSTGQYSSFSIQASFVALKDFCLKDIFIKVAKDLTNKNFLLELENSYQGSKNQCLEFYKHHYAICKIINDDHIYNYLLRNEFIVPLNIREISLDDDYGIGIEMLFPENPEELETEREKQFLDYINENKKTEGTKVDSKKGVCTSCWKFH